MRHQRVTYLASYKAVDLILVEGNVALHLDRVGGDPHVNSQLIQRSYVAAPHSLYKTGRT
jgi:hypothetical protein